MRARRRALTAVYSALMPASRISFWYFCTSAALKAANWSGGIAEVVREVSAKYFAPEKQSIVVVGDPAAVGAQLKQFGEFTVTDK